MVAHWSERFVEARPTHLLYYEFARQMMAREAVVAVNVGRQALPARAGLDRFKEQAGYRREALPLAVQLSGGLGKLARNRWMMGGLEVLRGRLGRRFPVLENVAVLRAAGKMRRGAGEG